MERGQARLRILDLDRPMRELHYRPRRPQPHE
jgi:hypothetical protein